MPELIGLLADPDSARRMAARNELVKRGGREASQSLVEELCDPLPHVRWEAAKALGTIADPLTAHSLVHALDDDDHDVRWVAGEGLTALGRPGLLATLSGLTRRARSIAFCRAAHHVLHGLRDRDSECADLIRPVLASLETSEPEVTAPPEAYRALVALKRGLASPCDTERSRPTA